MSLSERVKEFAHPEDLIAESVKTHIRHEDQPAEFSLNWLQSNERVLSGIDTFFLKINKLTQINKLERKLPKGGGLPMNQCRCMQDIGHLRYLLDLSNFLVLGNSYF